ncbi:MAG TPA: hypothetical protein PKN04_15490 [bacterium]|jgi:uncharacterized membrane protein|nr:hypothetical protein [bacterium]HNT67187.1 hypothetical protein [bacterium]
MKKFFLILLLLILIVVIALVVICALNPQKVANYAVEKSMAMAKTAVIENLPQGVSADSAAMIMDEMTAKIKAGEVSQSELQYLANTIQQVFSDNELDSTEAVQLLDKIKEITEPVAPEQPEPEQPVVQ